MSVGNIEDIVGAGDVSIGGALDPATGALPVQRVDDPRFDDNPNPVLVNETNLSVATHYFPDANGVAQLGYKSLSLAGNIVSGSAGETLTFSVEAWNGVEWIDLIGPFTDETGTSPIASKPTATNSTDNFAISWDHFPYQKWRTVVTVSGTLTSNSANVGSYQKAL